MLVYTKWGTTKYIEIHNCSMNIIKNNCAKCGKDMSHKLQIKNYFDNLDKALCSN